MALPRIAVIGAGVNGMSSALLIQQRLNDVFNHKAHVILVADAFGVATTTHGAAGLWEPYYLSQTPNEDILRWAQPTFAHLERLFHSGVRLHREEPDEPPLWHEIVRDFRQMPLAAVQPYGDFSTGYTFTTYVVEGARYLPYLQRKLEEAGGKLQTGQVTSLAQFAAEQQADVVVNCGGLLGGARLCKDEECYPIRGQKHVGCKDEEWSATRKQVVYLEAPWIQHYVSADGFYAIPNRDHLVCGGISQQGDWTTATRESEVDYILNGVGQFLPAIKGANIKSVWAGLRPGRTKVRLECQVIGEDAEDEQHLKGKTVPVVHCYGHGGSGHTLHWGCATEVADMVMQQIQEL